MYVDNAWAYMPVHTCRYYHWNMSMGKHVGMSIYIFFYLYMCQFMVICIDLHMCININVPKCPYTRAYDAVACTL